MVTLRSRRWLQGTAERSAWNRANMDTTKARVGKIWRKKLHRFGGLVVGRPGTRSWFFACRSCWLREALDKTIPFFILLFYIFLYFLPIVPTFVKRVKWKRSIWIGLHYRGEQHAEGWILPRQVMRASTSLSFHIYQCDSRPSWPWGWTLPCWTLGSWSNALIKLGFVPRLAKSQYYSDLSLNRT